MEKMNGSLRSRVDRLTNFQELQKEISNQSLLKKQQAVSKISTEVGVDMRDHWEQAIGLLMKPKSLK